VDWVELEVIFRSLEVTEAIAARMTAAQGPTS
jgi:hypothetical protein